jgi:hypothetical protein
MTGAVAARGKDAAIEALGREFFPQNRLDESACRRLLARLAPHGRASDADAVETLLGVLESVASATPLLPAFLLGELTVAVIAGEGPAIGRRPHFSRMLDAADVAFVRRVLEASGVGDAPVSRPEAEALFDLHDATAGGSNDPGFDELLHRAIASHLLAASGHETPPRRAALAPGYLLPQGALGPDQAAWLAERIMRDGRATTAEFRLLVLIGEPRSAPDLSVRKLIEFAA